MVVPPPTPPCSGAQPPPPPPACPKPAGSSLFGGSDAPGFLLASASASPSAPLASSSEAIVITSNIEPVTAMHKLISLQTFSGAWLWSDELADVIGCDIKMFRKWQIGSSISSAAKATAIALAFLSFRAADQRDVWDMVADKATVWLRQETGLNGGGIEKVLEEAERRLREVEDETRQN
ncbi:hypothetical protein B0A55_08824 [Friedmanniomyces simplex]|uniref:Uncharacterized protein n=1 Tax=Friedmanniomyces simplex TaxID=329884 RepID=A0A4V5NF84_9PEZI|nr:hypothetical protein B0A55_08824 [Friedmanniomyces simplex]